MEYAVADEPKRIGQLLIKDHHPHLHGMSVVYLFQNKRDKKTGQPVMPKRKGKDLYGQAKLVTGLNAFLASGDTQTDGDEIEPFFVILITKMSWDRMEEKHKTALVDHELMHCDFDTESGRPSLRDHDVTEFHEIVKRYGAWTYDLEMFFKAAKQIPLPLDTDPLAAAPKVVKANGKGNGKDAPVLTIHPDKKCSKCKKDGATDDGLCMKCGGGKKAIETAVAGGLTEMKNEVARRRGGARAGK